MPDILEANYNVSATNVTLTTTSETVIVVANAVMLPFRTHHLVVLAWAQLTTGTGTTAVTARIRRGALATDTLVSEANAEGVKITAGGTEPFFIMAAEDLQDRDRAQYCLTLTQTGATANGTALQAGILVLVM